MKLFWRYRYVIAGLAVAALGVALMLAGVLSKTDKAQGTQSDPSVGSSKYPAPKAANSVPPTNALATITDPGAIPALSDINAKCNVRGDNPPSLQDDGKGARSFSAMPANPSADTYKCAIARAEVAGYYVTGNSVACDEPVIELHDQATNKNWSFRPFCMSVSQSDGPTCKVTLVVTDYAGNFIWQDMPDLSWRKNILGDELRLRGSYAGC